MCPLYFVMRRASPLRDEAVGNVAALTGTESVLNAAGVNGNRANPLEEVSRGALTRAIAFVTTSNAPGDTRILPNPFGDIIDVSELLLRTSVVAC